MPVISGTEYNNALYIIPQSFIHNIAIPVSFLRFAIGIRKEFADRYDAGELLRDNRLTVPQIVEDIKKVR
jgi:hypothetical protein